jgi:hypothetical protein
MGHHRIDILNNGNHDIVHPDRSGPAGVVSTGQLQAIVSGDSCGRPSCSVGKEDRKLLLVKIV